METHDKKAVSSSIRALFKRVPQPRLRWKTGGAIVLDQHPPGDKTQSLGALYRNERDASAPADVCAAVGLQQGASWGQCIIRSQFIAAAKHGDMGAAKEITDRLEGRVPSADSGKARASYVRFVVIYDDELMKPFLSDLITNILARVPNPKLWDFLAHYVESQLPTQYEVTKREWGRLDAKEQSKLRKSLQAESRAQDQDGHRDDRCPSN